MEAATTSLGLLERARNGDRAAFDALLERYWRRLAVMIHYRMSEPLRRQVGPEDILQETMFRAARDIGGFAYRQPGSFLSWLASIADRVIADAARHGSRQKRDVHRNVAVWSDSHPGGIRPPADSRTPSRILAGKQRLDRLITRLDQLPPDYRDVIVLVRVQGLSTGEAANRMGRSREAVSLLLHRALKRFRELATK